jgi:ABC-type transporter Mla subunit MlaD
MIIKPLIGSPNIVLYTSVGTPLLKPNSTIKLMMSDGINDLVLRLEPALTTATHVLDNIDKITTYLADENSELKHILVNLEKLTAKLASSPSLLTSLTGDKKSTQELTKAISQTSKIAKDIKKITNDIATITSSLDSTIMKPARKSADEVELILKDIKSKLDELDGSVKAAGSFGPELIDIKDQVRVGLQKSDMLMDKVDALLGDQGQAGVTLP